MENRPAASSTLRCSVVLWPALLLGMPLACGKSSNDDGSVAAGGRGDAGSESGDSDGHTASGASSSTSSGGVTSSGGAGVGGMGGDGTVGGSTAGGADGSGGKAATGGTGGGSTEHLYDLGAECATPGEFGCSAANELLAMICDGDKKWALRETCSDDEKCDPTDGSGTGLCRVPVDECQENDTASFCSDVGVEECLPGGFDTEVLEECRPGSKCQGTECILVNDPCPDVTRLIECDTFPGCGGEVSECGPSEECASYVPEGYVNDAGHDSYFRTPSKPVCGDFDAFNGCPEHGIIVKTGVANGSLLKATIGLGWGISAFSVDEMGFGECVGTIQTGCIIVEPPGIEAYVVVVPLTDPPVARNLHFQAVAEGTTCD
jgi:hypothetical protein